MRESIKMFIIALALVLLLPIGVKAITEDEIKTEKKITIKAVEPDREDFDQVMLFEEFFNRKTGFILECVESYDSCTIYKQNDGEMPEEVATGVKIIFDYDKDAKKVVDEIMNKIPNAGINFTLNDIEMIYYLKDYVTWVRSGTEEVDPDPELEPNPIRYSSEYGNYIGYKNFIFEPRMGYDENYEIYKEGTATFEYNDTILGYGDGVSVTVPVVVFVNDDEDDVEGALQTRLEKYFPGIVVEADTSYSPQQEYQYMVSDARDRYLLCGELKTTWQEAQAAEQLDPSYDNQMARQNAYNNFSNNCSYFSVDDDFDDVDGYIADFEADAKEHSWKYLDKMFPGNVTLRFTNGMELYVGVVYDSSKVFNGDINVITSDTSSGVTISGGDKIPLDTLIQVAKLTSGTEYNKIIGLLNKENVDMFDIKLFSKSTSNYITQLDDGTFEVKIPIKEEFQGKSLVAYYVDNNDKVTEIPVTVSSDGKIAIFKTSHFSIYTLAEQEQEEEPKFNVTYDFNGGTSDGEGKFETESVAVGLDITKANFIDEMGVTPPEGKELDAIEINGTRVELGSEYMLNKDTVFKYIWKNVNGEEEATTPDTTEEETPKTNDNIMIYIVLASISLITLAGVNVYRFKYNK